ncbi:MAG: YdcF family protein [Candidatus Magnetobacterium sp. LHC-1]|uniref:YdcF family protein n=1 Tax=Candidatus Magnetobacterium casense TaxID=1455061 RepID=A0ABS6S299_9BACT|nr:YdcF family protein [Candidatus Magnetobacterium casensis]MBV6342965.1 YdcF family protein [Candidatus Magnetobacterium casensis]
MFEVKYLADMLSDKILMSLINPLLYVFVGLMALLLSRQRHKPLIFLLILYLYVISIPYTTNQFFARYWHVNDTYDPSVTYDAVVVMAGVTDANLYVANHFPAYVPDSHVFYTNGIERIWAGIYFVKNGFAKKLLFAQWKTKTYNEADVVKRYALSLGLKEQQIQLYGEVSKTIDEARGIRALKDKHAIKKLLLVTSESHMRRTLAMFRKQGLDPDVFSTNRHGTHVDLSSFLPTATALEHFYHCLYELAGYAFYYLKGEL